MDDSEKVIKKFHKHWISHIGFYFIGIVIFFSGFYFSKIFLLLGPCIFILGEILRRSEMFYILGSGVARTYNFLSTSRKFVEYENIQNIEVHQSFFENILGIGNVEFDTSGTHRIELGFYHVESPYTLEKLIRNKIKAN